MKMYCIYSDPEDVSMALLKASAESRGLEFIPINTEGFNYLNQNFDNEKFLLYRVSTIQKAKIIEKQMYNNNAVTFYAKSDRVFYSFEDLPIYYEKLGFKIPKTVSAVSSEFIKDYIDYLGGFPIIAKVLGGSHGVGVIKAESESSLSSIIDFLIAKETNFVLREFIDFEKHARLIVLNDRVVDSIEYLRPDGDFRTNAGEDIKVVPQKFSPEIEKASIDIVRSRSVEFGGVDVLIKGNDFYIAEANFPCFFPRAQRITNVDISGMMIDYLLEKSKNV